MKYYEKSYLFLTYMVYFLYIVLFFGISNQAPMYLHSLQYYFKVFIGILLIYIFNPFSKEPVGNIQRDIAFTAGVYLLTSISLDSLIHNFIHDYKTITNRILY